LLQTKSIDKRKHLVEPSREAHFTDVVDCTGKSDNGAPNIDHEDEYTKGKKFSNRSEAILE
jgi:hypothetical protein